MKTHFILLILSGCLLLSFQNDKLPQKNTIYPAIIGTWKKVKCVGGITGGYYAADTTKKNLLIYNEDGTYMAYIDDIEQSGNYYISHVAENYKIHYTNNRIGAYLMDDLILNKDGTYRAYIDDMEWSGNYVISPIAENREIHYTNNGTGVYMMDELILSVEDGVLNLRSADTSEAFDCTYVLKIKNRE